MKDAENGAEENCAKEAGEKEKSYRRSVSLCEDVPSGVSHCGNKDEHDSCNGHSNQFRGYSHEPYAKALSAHFSQICTSRV